MTTLSKTNILSGFLIVMALIVLVADVVLPAIHKPAVASPVPSTYEMTIECQKIAATSTNKDWHYTDCLKELQSTVKKVNTL